MKKLLVGFSALAMFALTAPVMGQTADVQSLSRELERLRNDLVDLQRFVYAGEGEAVIVVPSTGSSADSAAVQLGIQQLEEKLRLLTGRVEDLEYQQRQLNARMDTLVADTEARRHARSWNHRDDNPAAAGQRDGSIQFCLLSVAQGRL